MNNTHTNGAGEHLPNWLTRLLPLFSLLLGAAALWYTWFIWNGGAAPWYGWIRIAFTLAIGVLCLAATPLLLLGKPAGWSVFKAGFTLVPIMLAVNLVILIVRAVIGIATGSTLPFLERLFSEPRNLIFPIIVIALVTLGAIGKKSKSSTDAGK